MVSRGSPEVRVGVKWHHQKASRERKRLIFALSRALGTTTKYPSPHPIVPARSSRIVIDRDGIFAFFRCWQHVRVRWLGADRWVDVLGRFRPYGSGLPGAS